MADDPIIKNTKGLALPIKKGAGGAFQIKLGADLAWGSFLYALFCPIGGRAMNRRYGSALSSVLFSPMTITTSADVEDIVRRCAQEFVPQILIDRVIVSKDPNTKSIKMSVRFRLRRDASVPVEKTVLIPMKG